MTSDSSRALQRQHTAASTSATSVPSFDTSSPFIFFFNDAESRQRNFFSYSSDAVSIVVLQRQRLIVQQSRILQSARTHKGKTGPRTHLVAVVASLSVRRHLIANFDDGDGLSVCHPVEKQHQPLHFGNDRASAASTTKLHACNSSSA